MNFLYYIPGLRGVDKAVIGPLGLYDRLERIVSGAIDRGPDGGPGLLLAASGTPLVQPVGIRWVPVREEGNGQPADGNRQPATGNGPDGKATYYLGYDPADLPTPNDLLRSDIDHLVLRPVVLGDGQPWHIPVAMMVIESQALTALPRRLTLNDNGDHTYAIEARYRRLWDTACDVVADFMTAMAAAETGQRAGSYLAVPEQLQILCDALSVVYRMGVPELAALGLYSESTIHKALQAMIGGDDQKKTPCTMSSGHPA